MEGPISQHHSVRRSYDTVAEEYATGFRGERVSAASQTSPQRLWDPEHAECVPKSRPRGAPRQVSRVFLPVLKTARAREGPCGFESHALRAEHHPTAQRGVITGPDTIQRQPDRCRHAVRILPGTVDPAP
jgi:hypothetical protein